MMTFLMFGILLLAVWQLIVLIRIRHQIEDASNKTEAYLARIAIENLPSGTLTVKKKPDGTYESIFTPEAHS
jgi:hypothetical protein